MTLIAKHQIQLLLKLTFGLRTYLQPIGSATSLKLRINNLLSK